MGIENRPEGRLHKTSLTYFSPVSIFQRFSSGVYVIGNGMF
jgi:hypothetical protein